jgi:hypothetical protein
MKTITQTLLFIIFGLLISNSSNAQDDYSSKLKKDLVTVVAGKYNISEFMLLSYSDGNSAQVKMSATCPIDVMNRDNFISIYTSFGIISLLGMLGTNEAELPDIKDLDELIGDPDITINLIMAKNGIQMQVITAEGKNNVTTTWEEFFK